MQNVLAYTVSDTLEGIAFTAWVHVQKVAHPTVSFLMKSGRCSCKKRARVLAAPRFVADDASTEVHGSVDIVPKGLA